MKNPEKLKELLSTLSNVSETAKLLLNSLFDYVDYKEYVFSYEQDEFGFHPNGKVGCLLLDDDYALSIRCDHLIWMEGYTENYDDYAIVIIGNHKGSLTSVIIYSVQGSEEREDNEENILDI